MFPSAPTATRNPRKGWAVPGELPLLFWRPPHGRSPRGAPSDLVVAGWRRPHRGANRALLVVAPLVRARVGLSWLVDVEPSVLLRINRDLAVGAGNVHVRALLPIRLELPRFRGRCTAWVSGHGWVPFLIADRVCAWPTDGVGCTVRPARMRNMGPWRRGQGGARWL